MQHEWPNVIQTACHRTKYPPSMILFHPFHYEFDPFPGFVAGLIPIFPSEVKFTIHNGKNTKLQISRRQFPLVGGYAFTDHKAQGQTIENVNIRPTKRFSVDAFAAYIALSRSRGRESIRLLRDFDDKIFTKLPSEHLQAEEFQLADLTRKTKVKFEAGMYNYGK